MHRVLQVLLMLLCFCSNVHPQDHIATGRNALYIELTNTRPRYSLNFERHFSRRETTQYGIRAGLSLAKNEVYIPLGLSLIKGRSPHYFEASLVGGPYMVHYSAAVRGVDDVDTYVYAQPSLAYRYQRWKTGPFVRLRAGPSFLLDIPSEKVWRVTSRTEASVFLSVGYSF